LTCTQDLARFSKAGNILFSEKLLSTQKWAKSEKWVFLLFYCLGKSKLFWGGETQVLDGKLCENDEFGV
jgi:hypothetical protein